MVNLTNNDIWYAIGLSAIFAAGYLSFSIAYQFLIAPIRRRRVMEGRLKKSTREEQIRTKIFKNTQVEAHSLAVSLVRRVLGRDRLDNLQRQLLQADIYWPVSKFLGVTGFLGVVGLLLGQLIGSLPAGALICLGFLVVPFLFLRFKINRKAGLVEKQLPDVMELLARSLRAGHTLPSAIELASKETADPLGVELKMAYEEQRLGISMSEALRHMAERVASPDLRYFVTAVLVQAETGGNLAEIMEKIGFLIRDRLRVKGKIRALTAEGRLSAAVLTLIPFALFVVLYFVNNSYVMTLLTHPGGRKLMMVGMVSIVLGIFSMRKIINQVRL
jgi:tight adherence protein B